MTDDDLDGLVDPETAAKIKAAEGQKKQETNYLVLPENWPALQLFLSCATQWRYAPLGGITGLDYQALAALMDMQQIPLIERPERLAQVQWIERGVLETLSKQKSR